MKRTKIVCTIGPSSESKKTLTEMARKGMNVARLNFSHGDFSWHKKAIRQIRKASRDLNIPIGIIADLQGPRIRISNEKEFSVSKNEIILVAEAPLPQKSSSLGKIISKIKKATLKNKQKRLDLDLKGVVKMVKSGSNILIEDGLIKIKILERKKDKLIGKVTNGGVIKPRKGVNIPGISAKLGAITTRDKEVLDFALAQDVDFVAMSFVRTADEVECLRGLIRRKSKTKNGKVQIISKIERKEAIRNFDKILNATDIVMVARGDLGIEMPQADVPILQKEICAKCLRAGKPVIVATQMLDSMIRNPRPTRAEVTDVSNAVIDHADALMLSGETANGKYPVEAVQTMSQIIKRTERSPFDDLGHGFLGDQASSVSAAIAQSSHELLKDSRAKAVVVASISGFTARMITRHRPEQKIYVMTNNEKTHNQLTLVWGVRSFVLPDCKDLDELLDKSMEVIKKNKLLKKRDRVVIVAGRPHVKLEHMSLVKVEEIK
ncbi:MAG: pyruvate kinase [Candidatus Moranbacteria bacterium RBG_13_45_13]|nr:MAG: pyruvate kinase [Candidatus Moranbacteria bacterium RBG_13_45_13]